MSSAHTYLEVSGLTKEVSLAILLSVFSSFGAVAKVNLTEAGGSCTRAIVKFQRREDAMEAVQNLDNSTLGGLSISVKPIEYSAL
jgi:RNA recognition motif-containing protein